jgi:hypothetical protein
MLRQIATAVCAVDGRAARHLGTQGSELPDNGPVFALPFMLLLVVVAIAAS